MGRIIGGAIGRGRNCLGGDWHGGKLSGGIVLEAISRGKGGDCPEGNCPRAEFETDDKHPGKF